MLKRADDVRALLDHAKNTLAKIKESYQQSLHRAEIDKSLSIDIKNFCENLRSALDYVAHDIRETHCAGANPKDRFYFPIFADQPSFVSQVRTGYPGLETSKPNLWNYLESVQPFVRPENLWLGLFNRLNNENKHGALVPQERREWEEVKVTVDGVGSVGWNRSGVRFGDGVEVLGAPIDPATQLPVPGTSQKVERIRWVDFRFEGLDIPALDLLRKSLAGVDEIVSRISKLA